MNIIAKNMELIFVTAVALVSMTGLANSGADARRIDPPEVVKVGAAPEMTVITVSAKRLTPAEKAKLAD